MGAVLRELRFAARRLLRQPSFTMVTAGTLAIGLGATTALYTVVDGVLLRPLPYEDAEQLVFVGHHSTTDLLGMPDGGFVHYSERSQALDQLALYIETSSPVAGGDTPLELGIIQASPELLPLLRVAPVLGRGFTPEDHEAGAPAVALVTHRYWTNHLGSDPDVLGKPVANGSPRTVIGVLPEGFEFERPEALVIFGNRFDAPDMFVPLGRIDPARARFGNFMYHSLGRLAPGATPEAARQELQLLMAEAVDLYPGGLTSTAVQEGAYRAVVVGLQDFLVRDVARVIWILMGACLLVLVIAGANVANLFLVRADARRSELGVRRALGASRRSLAWAFYSESVLISVLGGAAGLALAAVGTRLLLHGAPVALTNAENLGLDGSVVLFALLATVATSVGIGSVPFLRSGRHRARSTLLEGSRGGTAGAERSRTRHALLVGQVAMATVLLIGSTLLVQTFLNLRSVDPGFDGSRTATVRLSLSRAILTAAGRTESASDLARSRFMIDVVDRLERLPGVEVASFSADLPLDGDEWHDYVTTEEDIPESNADATRVARVFVGADYFAAIGATLLEGREHSKADFADQPRTVVVNRTFAEQQWPPGTAVGRRIAQFYPGITPELDVWYTVVGVVEDVRETSLMVPAEPTVYLPTAFIPGSNYAMWISNMVAIARVSGDPAAVLPRMRDEILAYRSDVPMNSAATLPEITAASFREVAFATRLISLAAALSMLLGAVGIYGAVSYVVGQRTREFGVRMALGAPAAEVRRLVLSQGGWVGILGTLIGVGVAVFAARILESLLFGVTATEPLLYGGVALGLMTVVLMASLVPAFRASRIDPSTAMRTE